MSYLLFTIVTGNLNHLKGGAIFGKFSYIYSALILFSFFVTKNG